MDRFRVSAAAAAAAAVVGSVACGGDRGALEARPDSAALVTTLGVDTVAVERFVTTPERVEAEAVIRTPRATYRRYVLERGAGGEPARLEVQVWPAGARGGPPLRTETVTFEGDSIRIESNSDGTVGRETLPGAAGAVRLEDYLYWPLDLALRTAMRGEGDSVVTRVLTEDGISEWTFVRTPDDSVQVLQPDGGRQAARIDARGRLRGLSSLPASTGLTVQRQPWVALDSLADHFATLEEAGRGLGPLAGRAETVVRTGRAAVRIDYGTPARRGRVIWGGLVPYGEVWRTGANLATHLETDRDLRIGDLDVPKGRYTLFTIPDQARSQLVLNRQTGQPGNQYDESQDLGRVTLQHRVLAEPVDVLEIGLTVGGSKGELTIRWDRLELVAPVEIR
ncbi:MAG: DUF2911 domain-containing protein [Gemmatimonadota bacterium]